MDFQVMQSKQNSPSIEIGFLFLKFEHNIVVKFYQASIAKFKIFIAPIHEDLMPLKIEQKIKVVATLICSKF